MNYYRKYLHLLNEDIYFESVSSLLLPPILYHATQSANVESILRVGLDPAHSDSEQSGIYLSDNIDVAANYQGFKPNVEWTMFAIKTTGLKTSKLNPDNYELQDVLDTGDYDDEFGDDAKWYDLSWEDSLRLCNQVVYMGKISPEFISIIKIMKPWIK